MKTKFYVIICGSRDFENYELLEKKCDCYLSNKLADENVEVIVVSGCCKGADKLGERYAKEHGLSVISFPANWNKHGKSAGYIRNTKMAEIGNACIAFLSSVGNNTGTKMMIRIAREKNLLVREVDENEYLQ